MKKLEETKDYKTIERSRDSHETVSFGSPEMGRPVAISPSKSAATGVCCYVASSEQILLMLRPAGHQDT